MASEAAEKIAAKHNAAVKSNSDPDNIVNGYADRLEKLEEEKKALGEDIRELKKEAKGVGVLPRALAQVVKERMEDQEKRVKRREHEATVDRYRAALRLLD